MQVISDKGLRRVLAACIPGVCLLGTLIWVLAFALRSDAQPPPSKPTSQMVVRSADPPPQLAENTNPRPSTSPSARRASESGGGVLRAYPAPPNQVEALAARIESQLPNATDVRIVADVRNGQILVAAPVETQAWIAEQLTPTPAAGTPARLAPTHREPPVVESHTVELHRPGRQLEQQLAAVLGGRLAPLATANPQRASYRLAMNDGQTVDVLFDHSTQQVTVRGDARSLDGCLRLVRALDAAPDDGATRLVSVNRTKGENLERTVVAVSAGGAAGGDTPAGTAPAAAGDTADNNGDGLSAPVHVDRIDGVDLLILRGHQRDVERAQRIIEEIERLSAETEPAIEIRPLAHVDCSAMAALVSKLYEQVFSTRRGDVSITALVKPNALLLAGRPENVRTVAELVARLDQPVAPHTQFQVFRLRHAAADDAVGQLRSFFDGRTELGARVRVTGDFRSNSLIVQAAPRDMAEVAELIGRIDTPTSAAINELRVVHLENALAADLAPILQAAVHAQSLATGRTGGDHADARREQPSPSGQPTASAAQGATAKSTMLRFLTVDSTGKQLLNSGILTDVRITADARANALLVSAPADSMELLEALIHQLDRLPTIEAEIKVFTIANGNATTMKELLEKLFGAKPSAEGPAVRTGAGESDSSLVSLRFGVDVRTNSVIASGTPGDLAVVEAILMRLDDSEVRNRRSIVYRLRVAPAEAVAKAINEFLRNERQVQTATPGLYSAFEQIDREVVVVPESVSNSLIVSATPQFFDEIEQLVRKLDERPPMVMIQVLIAQVDLNNFEDFGVELGLQDSLLFDRSLLSNLVTTTQTTQTSTIEGITTTTEDVIQGANVSPGFAFNNLALGNSGSDKSLATSGNVAGQALSNFGVGRASGLGYGGMVLSASSESVSVLIRALQQCGRMEVLSRPQVMTLDNQQAFIHVGQRIGMIRSTQVNEAGQSNNVEPEDVGLLLEVTPRISPDGLVVMKIKAEKSELGAEADGTPVAISATGEVIRQPPINTTTTNTEIAAVDGQTVVLAGLITKLKEEEHRRVPFLADIPVLGHLFRYDLQRENRRELLIVMTPHVVRNDDDANLMREIEASRMHWCLCDVMDVGGDGVLRSRGDQWLDSETEVIYPGVEPEGELIPTPEGQTDPSAIVPPSVPAPQPPAGVEPERLSW